MKPSFSKINYAVRPNKNVERKLMAEALLCLKDAFGISDYNYIGMGSMWFTDFILFHKVLLIDSMFSIEKEEYAKRAAFNKPYDCITVVQGDSTAVLPSMPELGQSSIIWLDYDTGLDGPVLKDTKTVCEKAKNGNIFMITVNANHEKIRKEKIAPHKYSRMNALRKLAGDLVPIGTKDTQIQKGEFPKLLARMLFAHVKTSLKRAGRREWFYPLFNFLYSDSTPMVTIGGMIVNEDDKSKLERCNLPKQFNYITGEAQFTINMPLLTVKEKITIDSILPRENVPTSADIENLGFLLSDDEIKSYHELYRFYPMFSEFCP